MVISTQRTVGTLGPIVGCLLVMGCVSSQGRINESHVEHATAHLQRRLDADSLAAAGLFQVTKNRSRTVALLARAEAAAPQRADLLWLYIRVCQSEPSCDPRPKELMLRTLSPSNGAGWLGELTRAVSVRDDIARDAALMAISHSNQFDIYWTTLVGRLSMAAVRTGQMPPNEAMLVVTGVLAAIGVPAYSPVFQTCKGDLLRLEDIRAACKGVATAFENGDTSISEMVGVAIAKRVWPAESPEWMAAAERYRVNEYRRTLLSSMDASDWNAAQAQKYLAFCLEQSREQDASRGRLLAEGKDPDPPAM